MAWLHSVELHFNPARYLTIYSTMVEVYKTVLTLLFSLGNCLYIQDGGSSNFHPTGNQCDYTELRASPNSCSSYLQCSYPTEYERPCSSIFLLDEVIREEEDEDVVDRQRLYFSYERQICDRSDQVQCLFEALETTNTAKTTLPHRQVCAN